MHIMTMNPLLYRTLNPWEFAEETLHENVQLWSPKWKSDWEEYSATLCCELELHEALCDALAENSLRKRHAGDKMEHDWSIEAFQHLTQTIRKVEETGDLSHLQEDRDVIQRLTAEEQDLFMRVVQRLFPDKTKDVTILQDLTTKEMP
jgi:hypothetical protein